MNYVAVSVKFIDMFARIKAGCEGFENQGLWTAKEGFGKVSPVQGFAIHEVGLKYIGLTEDAGAIDLPYAKARNISMTED